MVIIADYGVGNLASVCNMFRKLGVSARISRDPKEISTAERVVLPGVGHFDHGMRMLDRAGLRSALDEVALNRCRPVLGICLGAQILGTGSEEGALPGLGWIDMYCQRFPETDEYRVPHMGWDVLEIHRPCPLFKYADLQARYYFVHSYYIDCKNQQNAVATTFHGLRFASVVQNKNIFGAQFHPEKSHRHGMAILKAFSEFEAGDE